MSKVEAASGSPVARRLAKAGEVSAHAFSPRVKSRLARADRARSWTGLLFGSLALLVLSGIAVWATNLASLGPSPVRAAFELGGRVLAGLPAPATSERTSKVAAAPLPPVTPVAATEASAPVPPIAEAAPARPADAGPKQNPAPEAGPVARAPRTFPGAGEIQIADKSMPSQPDYADPAKVVAPIAQKLQSLEERLAALNAATEQERLAAEQRANERRELDRREAELREQQLRIEQQRVAALPQSAPVAPQTASAEQPKCLSAVEAAASAVIVPFETGSATILPVHGEQLKRFAALLKSCPDAKLEVTGHTDSQGALESNFSLSWRRADAVIGVFQAQGLDPSRFTPVGLGTRNPLSQTPSNPNPIDRRVELKLR